MSPSLSGLTAPASSAAAVSNSLSNQVDESSSGTFEGFLREIYAAVVPGSAAPPAELPGLPQDGKLLPLLQQTLASDAAGGGDLTQIIERLAAKLDQLTAAGVPVPDQQLAVALQQVVQAIPGLSAALPADTLAAIARAAGAPTGSAPPAAVVIADGTSGHRPADPHLPGQPATGQPATGQSPAGQPIPAAGDGGQNLFDTVLNQLTAAVTARNQPAPDMAALLTAFKRFAGDNRLTPPDAATHAGAALSGATVSATASSTAASPGMPMVTVATAFGQPDWDQELGERIRWLAGQKMQGAQVKLNPANLGPMEIRIQIQNDQANVQFTAHHAVVREALEAAMPRLREMLAASGVVLVNVDVSGQGPSAGHQQAATQDGDNFYPGSAFGSDDAMGAEPVVQTPLVSFYPRGRLDLFA